MSVLLSGGGGGRRHADNDGAIIDRRGVESWLVEPGFKDDTFTFVRIAYQSWGGGWYNRRWDIDGPDSELNFSFRLQQLTSIKVNPEPIVLTLTDPRLFDYPFIYIVEPGYLEFSADEVKALRHYLLNGGFLMVDDFWGEAEWHNFANEIRRVFPDRQWHDVPLSHDIFHCVYDLKERPQVSSIGVAERGYSYERPDARKCTIGPTTTTTAACASSSAITRTWVTAGNVKACRNGIFVSIPRRKRTRWESTS